ncbi:MAG: DUF1178 family protein [Hyphomicrobiaceae bacterium]
MIRYRLQCRRSHEFEAWFPSSEGFEQQVDKGLVACPECGSRKVSKALMAPSVVTSKRKDATAKARKPRKKPGAASTPPAPAPANAQHLMADAVQRELLRELKTLRDKVLAESEYVGPGFADEARKIHDKESPSRGIYGEASLDDVKELAEDGIDVFPLPVLPDDKN